METSVTDARAKLDAAAATHFTEHSQLLERHAEDTRLWQMEVDRGRQLVKEAANEHERQVKALRSQLQRLQGERTGLQEEFRELRAEMRHHTQNHAMFECRGDRCYP